MSGDVNKLKELLVYIDDLDCPDCYNTTMAMQDRDNINNNEFTIVLECKNCHYRLEISGIVKKYMNLVNDIWVDLPNNMTDKQYIEKYFSDAVCAKDLCHFYYDNELDEFLFVIVYLNEALQLSFAAQIANIKFEEKIP